MREGEACQRFLVLNSASRIRVLLVLEPIKICRCQRTEVEHFEALLHLARQMACAIQSNRQSLLQPVSSVGLRRGPFEGLSRRKFTKILTEISELTSLMMAPSHWMNLGTPYKRSHQYNWQGVQLPDFAISGWPRLLEVNLPRQPGAPIRLEDTLPRQAAAA